MTSRFHRTTQTALGSWPALQLSILLSILLSACGAKGANGPGSETPSPGAGPETTTPERTPRPAPAPAPGATGRASTSGLVCAISGKGSYNKGDPVDISWTLTNKRKVKVHLLNWQTPLEARAGKMLGNSFKVKRNGTSIRYTGIMIKRGDPTKTQYVSVAPDGSVSAQVDLAKSYDFSIPGTYQVTYVKGLFDLVEEGKGTLPNPRGSHNHVPLQSNTITFRIVDK